MLDAGYWVLENQRAVKVEKNEGVAVWPPGTEVGRRRKNVGACLASARNRSISLSTILERDKN
jgi:hypothetical protein